MKRKPKYKTEGKRLKIKENTEQNTDITEKKASSKEKKTSIAEKKVLIENFCRHIRQGFSKDSFVEAAWDEVWGTAQYLDECRIPEENPKIKNSRGAVSFCELIMQAIRSSRKKWEETGLQSVEKREFNAAVWKQTEWNKSDGKHGKISGNNAAESADGSSLNGNVNTQNIIKTVYISFAKREDYEDTENESGNDESKK